MPSKIKRDISFFILTALIFVAFTAAVKFIDPSPTGLEGTVIGFSSMNTAIHKFIGGFHKQFYDISEVAGIILLAIAACFAVFGIFQLIKRKSFKRVDADIYALAAFYIAVLVFYVFFDKIALNYRPIDMGAGLEPSYPSSHTMLSVCIAATSVMQFKSRIRKKPLLIALETAVFAVAAATLVFRLLSGAHWATDIIGGILISAHLIMFYVVMLDITAIYGENKI